MELKQRDSNDGDATFADWEATPEIAIVISADYGQTLVRTYLHRMPMILLNLPIKFPALSILVIKSKLSAILQVITMENFISFIWMIMISALMQAVLLLGRTMAEHCNMLLWILNSTKSGIRSNLMKIMKFLQLVSLLKIIPILSTLKQQYDSSPRTPCQKHRNSNLQFERTESKNTCK